MSRIINQPVRPSNHWWFSYLVLLFFYKKRKIYFVFFSFVISFCVPILISSHFFFGLYGFTYIDLSNRPISIVWRIAFLFFWIIAIIQSMYFSFFFSFHNHLNCWFDLPIEQGEINITHPLFFPSLVQTHKTGKTKNKKPVDLAQNITRKCSRWLTGRRLLAEVYHFLT